MNQMKQSENNSIISLSAILDSKLQNTQVERQVQFKSILRELMPHLDNNIEKIIMAQIMISLKLEGVISDNITDEQSQMIQVIKDAIIHSPEKKKQALQFAYNLLDNEE